MVVVRYIIGKNFNFLQYFIELWRHKMYPFMKTPVYKNIISIPNYSVHDFGLKIIREIVGDIGKYFCRQLLLY